ncbi:MAG: hypothetical protein ACTSYN_00910, partial [Candidatus Heimdallarchaeaceae archaeon]
MKFKVMTLTAMIIVLLGISSTTQALGNEVGWHLQYIDIQGAWQITQGDPNIVVAIIDSGVDFSHPELS